MIRKTQESVDAKAKGEKLQKDIVARLREAFPEHAEFIVSSPMSAHGEDIQILSNEARKDIPLSIEAKYRMKGLSPVYSAYAQAAKQVEAIASTLSLKPILVIQQEGYQRLYVLNEDDLLDFITPDKEPK